MADFGAMLSESLRSAVEQGDTHTANRVIETQVENSVISEVLAQATGADPMLTSPLTAANEPEMEASRIAFHWLSKNSQAMQAAKEAGLDTLQKFWKKEVVDLYKERNSEPIAQWRPDLSEEEQIRLMYQMEPITVDPNLVAEMRQVAVQVDQAMKPHGMSFWTHPDFQEIAGWLNRESAPDRPGYIVSGPQEMPFSATASQAVLTAADVVGDFTINLGNGLWDLMRKHMASSGLVGEAPPPPSNFVRDDDTGQIIFNSARPFGIVSQLSALRSFLLGEDVMEQLADLGTAREMEAEQRGLLEQVTVGVSSVAGMFVGFAPAAAAMGVGHKAGRNLISKGLVSMGKELTPTGKATSTAGRVLQVLGGQTGAAVANGLAMTTAYGRMSDYGHEFITGMIHAPVILAFGAMGRRVERTLAERKKMPRWLAQDIGSMVEGVGFGTLEAAEMGALWDFLRDPNESTFQVYASNMLGFIVGKRLMGHGMSPSEIASRMAGSEIQRAHYRRVVAEKVAKGEAAPEAIEGASPKEVELVKELGQLSLAKKEAAVRGEDPDPQLRSRMEDIELELDVLDKGTESKPTREARRLEAETGLPLTKEPLKVRPKEGEAASTFDVEKEGLVSKYPVEGARRTPLSKIFKLLGGRPDKPGVPLWGKTFLEKPGSTVQVKFREGRVPPGAEGIFKILPNVARLKGGRRLVVATHEWSHGMMRHTIAAANPRNYFKAADEWMRDLSRQDPGVVAEGREMLRFYPESDKMLMDEPGRWASEVWAELFARKLLGDAKIDTEAPGLSRWADEWLAKPENAKLRQEFKEIQDEIWNWRNQGVEAAFGETIGSRASEKVLEKEKRRDKGGIVHRLKKAFIEELADVERDRDRWMRAVGEDISNFPMIADPVAMMKLARGKAAAITRYMIKEGMVDPYGRKVGESFEAIMRDAIKELKVEEGLKDTSENRLRELTKFIVAARSIELLGRGKKTPFDKSEYLFIIDEVKNRNPGVVKLAERVKQWSDGLVDFSFEAGAMSAKDAQLIKDAYGFYLPFERVMEGPMPHGGGRGVAERGTGLKRVEEGSALEIKDPIRALENVTTAIVQRALQARGMKAMHILARSSGAGGFAEVVPKSKVPQHLRVDRIIEEMKKVQVEDKDQPYLDNLLEGLSTIPGISESTLIMFAQKPFPFGERSIVAVPVHLKEWEISLMDPSVRERLRKDNDTVQWLEVEPATYNALMGLERVNIGPVARAVANIFRFPTQVIRKLAVEYNPFWMMKNAGRDINMKPVYSKRGFGRKYAFLGGTMDWIVGSILFFKRSDARELFEAGGASIATFQNAGETRKIISDTASGFWGQTKSALAKGKEIWRDFVGGPEKFLRIKEIQDTLKEERAKGSPEEYARLKALQAGVEVMIDYSKGGAVARALNVSIPFFKASVLGWEKTFRHLGTSYGLAQAFANITVPQLLIWTLFKDEEWYQARPEWERRSYYIFSFDGGDTIIRIPKPFEMGVIMGSLPEMILDMSTGKERDEVWAMSQEIMFPYIKSLEMMIPQLIAPIYETISGRSRFRGRELTPSYLEREKAKEEQTLRTTMETSKLLFSATKDFLPFIDNPIEMQNLLDQYTAGWTTGLGRIAEDIMGLKNSGEYSSMNPLETVSRTFVTTPFKYSAQVSRFYEEWDEMEDLRKGNKLDQAQKARHSRYNSARRKMTRIRDDVRSGNLTQVEGDRMIHEEAKKARSYEYK